MTDTEPPLLTRTRDIFANWSTLDWDIILASFTEDARFQSMMREPTVGVENIRALFTHAMRDVARVTIHLQNLAANGNLVFAERVDEFEIAGRTGRLPVVAALEFRGDLISAWREYYDLQTLLGQMGLEQDYATS